MPIKYVFEWVNKVTEYCLADMLYGLFTHSREFVPLCCKYNVDVALCYSGAIFAAVCNGFSQVVF